MSQPPPPYAYPAEPAVRPTSVTVMAIIGIIFGAMGFLCSPFSLFPYYVELPQPNPIIDAVKEDRMLLGWTVAATVMNWILAIFLLAASIAALGLREWARQMLLGWSIGAILLTVAHFIINWMYVFPKMREIAEQQPKAAAAAAAVGGWIGAGVGLALGLGIPAAMLFFMTRPHVKDVFARGARRII